MAPPSISNGWFDITFQELLDSFYHVVIVCTDGIAIRMGDSNFFFIDYGFTIFQVIFQETAG